MLPHVAIAAHVALPERPRQPVFFQKHPGAATLPGRAFGDDPRKGSKFTVQCGRHNLGLFGWWQLALSRSTVGFARR